MSVDNYIERNSALEILVAEGWDLYMHMIGTNADIEQTAVFRWKFAVLRELECIGLEEYEAFAAMCAW